MRTGRFINNDILNAYLDYLNSDAQIIQTQTSDIKFAGSQNADDAEGNVQNVNLQNTNIKITDIINDLSSFVQENKLIDIDLNFGGVGFNINSSFGMQIFDISLLYLLIQNLMNKPFSEVNVEKLKVYNTHLQNLNTQLSEFNDYLIQTINKKIENFDDDYTNGKKADDILTRFSEFARTNELSVCSFSSFVKLTSDEHAGKSKKEIQFIHRGLENASLSELYGNDEIEKSDDEENPEKIINIDDFKKPY